MKQHPLSFDLLGAFMCIGSQGDLLNLEDENMWPFTSNMGRAQSPLSFFFYGIPVHRGETVQSGAYL